MGLFSLTGGCLHVVPPRHAPQDLCSSGRALLCPVTLCRMPYEEARYHLEAADHCAVSDGGGASAGSCCRRTTHRSPRSSSRATTTTARSWTATSSTPFTGARPPARAGQGCGIMTSRCAGKAVAARRRACILPLVHRRQCEGVTRAGRRSAACRGLAVCSLFAVYLGAPTTPTRHLAAHPRALWAACTGQRPSSICAQEHVLHAEPCRLPSVRRHDAGAARAAQRGLVHALPDAEPHAGRAAHKLVRLPDRPAAGHPEVLEADGRRRGRGRRRGLHQLGQGRHRGLPAILRWAVHQPCAPVRPQLNPPISVHALLPAPKVWLASVRSGSLTICLLQGCEGCYRQPKLPQLVIGHHTWFLPPWCMLTLRPVSQHSGLPGVEEAPLLGSVSGKHPELDRSAIRLCQSRSASLGQPTSRFEHACSMHATWQLVVAGHAQAPACKEDHGARRKHECRADSGAAGRPARAVPSRDVGTVFIG